MVGQVRGLVRDAVSLGAVVSFMAMIVLWGDAFGRLGSF